VWKEPQKEYTFYIVKQNFESYLFRKLTVHFWNKNFQCEKALRICENLTENFAGHSGYGYGSELWGPDPWTASAQFSAMIM